MNLVVEYDSEVDAAYIRLNPESGSLPALINIVVEDDRVADELVLDFTESGKLLGIEVLSASKTLAGSLLKEAKAPGEGRFEGRQKG